MSPHDQPVPIQADPAAEPRIVAYRLPQKRHYLKIVPAPADRFWMDVSTKGWANRCLPLRIANQAGWFILNDADFEVIWGGKPSLDSLRIIHKDASDKSSAVSSMFGYGIVTWRIPYLFRTPPGYNLLVRGPANSFKEGIAPMEGIVETDWLPYAFTMNWKITRPLKAVRFQRDEPICMITPVRREDLDSFAAEIRNMESSPELLESYSVWHERRANVVEDAKSRPPEAGWMPIQGHYIRGEGHLGERGHGHQTKLLVRDFAEVEPPLPVKASPQDTVRESSRRSFWQRWMRR
jgi:hypothetical protein